MIKWVTGDSNIEVWAKTHLSVPWRGKRFGIAFLSRGLFFVGIFELL